MPFDKTLDQFSAKELHDIAKRQAELFVVEDRLKTNQLRNVFSAIEKMRSLYKRKIKEQKPELEIQLEMELVMLKPKIAYAAGRQRSVRYKFFPFVRDAVDAVQDIIVNDENQKDRDKKNKAYSNFFALMEIVVSYHKFFESK